MKDSYNWMLDIKKQRNGQPGVNQKQVEAIQRDAVESYIKAVDDRAIHNMTITGVLEGAHHAAMKTMFAEMFEK